MRTHLILKLFAFIPVALLGQIAETAALSGRVIDDSGRPVGSSTVQYRRVDELSRDKNGRFVVSSTVVNRVVATSADGRFSVTGIPPGDYYVCAFPVLANQVGTCEWHRSSGPFTVNSGRTTVVPDLVLISGRTLRIRILDPNRRMTARSKLLVGVVAEDKYYRRAEPTAASAIAGVAVVLSVVVPPTAKVGLFVDTDLDVRDSELGVLPIRKRGPNLTLGVPGSETVLDLRLN